MIHRPYITCRELIDFIMGYLEGTLPPEQKSDFERHLNVCPSCVAYLDGYRQTVELGRTAFAPSDASARGFAPDALLEAIRAARSKQQ